MNYFNASEDDLSEMLNRDADDRASNELLSSDIQPLVEYIKHGTVRNGFVSAILSNDLMGTVLYAGIKERKKIYYLVEWLRENAPVDCWGTKHIVDAWILRKKKENQYE